MKKNLCVLSACLMMAGAVQADLVYSTDFTTTYNSGSGAFVLGGATPDVSTNEWFGSSNGAGIAGGDMTFDNSTANRFRGSGVWLDTTGWETGLVTVEIDVANFSAGADTDLIFQAYAANGVDAANTVSLDLHGGATAGLAQTGSATIGALGSEQYITANGTDVAFTFTYNGTDDFVGLVFAIRNANGGTAFASADVDNLTVNTAVAVTPTVSLIGITAE